MSDFNLKKPVTSAVNNQPITDLHTHCFTPGFGDCSRPGNRGLLLWGIDELVVYHYLVSEVYRVVPATQLSYEKFWQMSKSQQADHIWEHLFVQNTPISEACRGVLTTLKQLGLDPNEKTLDPYRKWFADYSASDYVDKAMELSNVDSITMTNEVFTDREHQMWLDNPDIGKDPRFSAVIRLDPLIRDWAGAVKKLNQWGYSVTLDLTDQTIRETRRFLEEWIGRMNPVYAAMSLPPEFVYPDPKNPAANEMIEKILMPTFADNNLPWAMMIGSRMRVNPALREAGDMVGKCDIMAVINLCAAFPENKFLVTLLSRENQYELCVAARNFGNLLPFGCWWWLNNPSLIKEITSMRLELLGPTFAPQHSDARVLDQIIYKWSHSRKIIADCLIDQYQKAIDTGRHISQADIKKDVRLLLRDNFRKFCGLNL